MLMRPVLELTHAGTQKMEQRRVTHFPLPNGWAGDGMRPRPA